MTGTSLRYYIFPKNTPWGVIRKADGTLQYKHVIRFENDDLRTQFVNRYLNEDSDYKTDLNSAPLRAFDSMTDLRIHFRILDPANFNRNINADFMVAKIGGVEKFFALKVLKTEGQTIFFEGELDIFFTYKIAFRENSRNFVARAHLNRLVPDGSRFKLPTVTDFPELFFAPEPFEIPLVTENNFGLSFSAAPSSIYWIIVWAIPSNDTPNNSFIWGKKSPYLILFFPFSTNYRPNSTNFKQCRVYDSRGRYTNTASPDIYEHLQKNPFVKKIIITPEPPLGFQKVVWSVIEDNNNVTFTRHGNDPLENNYGIRQIQFEGVNYFVYEIFRLDSQGGNKFKISGYADVQIPPTTEDIKILTPQFTKIYIKNYFDEKFEYGFSFIKNTSQTSLRVPMFLLSNFSMENPKSLFWIDEINRNNLLTGNLLEVNYLTDLPLNLDLSADYLLKNKNQIQTQLQQSRFNRNMGIANSVLKGLFAVGAVAAAPFTGGASLAAGAVVGGGIGASAVTGAIGAVKTHQFTEQRIDSQLADLSAQPQPIRIAGNQIFDVFTLPQNVFFTQFGIASPNPVKNRQIFDFFNMFGYQLNKVMNLNELLSNRKYWNFIKASDVFNSVFTTPELSSPIKQIISNAFAEGLTFWHFRDFENWNGVLSYGRLNWETNYNFPQTKKKSKIKKEFEIEISEVVQKIPKNAKKNGLKINDKTILQTDKNSK